jgi:hypothetical protein
MAGIVYTKQDSGVFGDKRYWLGTIAFDSDNHPAGGELLTASNFEFGTAIEGVMVSNGSALVYDRRVIYDPSTEKVVVVIHDGSPTISATDESAVVDVQVLAFGY